MLFFFLTLQYCIGFAIYQHESATNIHVFPILNPPPFSISPSSEYSGLVSFRIDQMDRLAVQGTLESLPQHHSSEASVLRFCVLSVVKSTAVNIRVLRLF